MGIKSSLAKYYAAFLINKLRKAVSFPEKSQDKVFNQLIASGRKTKFGKDHQFDKIENYSDFKNQVPLTDYEGLKPYIEEIKEGKLDILWPGRPIYFCKTSGTTSGAKYIPISKESIHNHIHSAKLALMSYVHETGKSEFIDGKMIFLQGSPVLDTSGKIPTGRLSGIVAHHVPAYLMKNRMPTMETNSIEDWEQKVDSIVLETSSADMRLISGIPSWVQMYFERLIENTEKVNIKSIFPNFSLFVYGGVNYEPYRPIFEKLIGDQVPSVETYPASEGFIAFQDSQKEKGLLLVVNDGIFYEFIPVEEAHNENPTRIPLQDVELDKNYAIVLNTNAGLWGYVIGDLVKFVSLEPYRIIVSGRIKHFTSAFGEHVIAEEVEAALQVGLSNSNAQIKEFHVAPQVNPESGLPYHEWFIEFVTEPKDLESFVQDIDQELQNKNPYYKDLIQGNILRKLVITKIKPNGFVEFMKSRGKLGGQNKIPRLSDDRTNAKELEGYAI
ncbi:MAG: hypothetical protein CL840_08075 [Crocinitomicaceae bacterium]|nr:hypothetical protein [Crocinitomicaceae bacterium]